MKLKVIGEKEASQNIEVKSSIFEVAKNPKLISQAVNCQQANLRNAIAHTKMRGEVSGGGRKPFKQKGTGRARAGSSRSPIWIGGGVTFGPLNVRNFSKRIPQKMLQQAIFMILSEKIKEKKLIVVKSLTLGKIATSEMQAFLEKLPIENGKILALLGHTDVNFELSAANLPFIKAIQVTNINLMDLLKYDYVLTDVEAIKALEKSFGGKNE